ncbi:Iron/ascorbate family oxidoreductase [Handroanthus impetiginosus]|uniref:gibberellin 3beta-dioxygenase n=1 Tax=Handroanthus impetiginosus TaxID=429701 RepID=A0A2G9GS62_9LAMI|nr:Iron/ascorbate family oxidoreductase [Handroanthus impetiginosus]
MATSLSEAYDNHLQLKHIIPLDFDLVHDVPESHLWTQTDQFPHTYQTCVIEPSIPIIDLRAPNVVELVGNACREWGMFQVINHEVPASLVEDVEGHARQLFELPAKQKLKALRSPRGVTGYGVARISPFFSKLMWHEGFTIMGSAVEHAKLLWPHQYEEFCDAVDNYQKKMKSLAHKIFLIILKALGLEEEEDDQETCFSASEGALQLNSYPSCPSPNRAIGLAPHTDSLLLTILHQNDVNGLQIFQEDMGWVSVPPVPEALVVNIGDLMHILSNGLFPTVCHRVVPNEARRRFSIAYFYGPPTDCVIAPLSKMSAPRFRPVMVKDYISLKNKHLEKALHLIRIN